VDIRLAELKLVATAKDLLMRFLVSAVLLTLVILAGPGTALCQEPRSAAVGVRELMQDPEGFPQAIEVSGVVSQVVAEAGLFGLIDVKEFKTCQKVTCASLVLPVRWDGPLPEVGTELLVTGKIRNDGERYLFAASDLKTVAAP